MRTPWFRKQNACWYVTVRGRQVQLSTDKDEAHRLWHEMQLVGNVEANDVKLAVLCEAFLEWSEANQNVKTYKWYADYLADLCTVLGAQPARALKPYHIEKWLLKRGWSTTQRRGPITAAKRVLNWAVEKGLLDLNPIGSMRRPASGRREVLIEAVDHDRILAAADRGHINQWRKGAFRTFLVALRHSGCRPGEVSRVTAAHYDARGHVWRYVLHKTSERTGKPRIVHLDACLETLTRILAHYRPTGPLFLNARGEPWTQNAIRTRMRRLRASLGLPDGTVSYSYRHTYTTDALVNGVDVATAAELLGHSGTAMISRHYGHLDQRAEHLRKAAAVATRKPES